MGRLPTSSLHQGARLGGKMQKSGAWYLEAITPELTTSCVLKEVIYIGRTQHQEVQVLEVAPFGRCLVLDGKTQSAESGSTTLCSSTPTQSSKPSGNRSAVPCSAARTLAGSNGRTRISDSSAVSVAPPPRTVFQ